MLIKCKGCGIVQPLICYFSVCMSKSLTAWTHVGKLYVGKLGKIDADTILGQAWEMCKYDLSKLGKKAILGPC